MELGKELDIDTFNTIYNNIYSIILREHVELISIHRNIIEDYIDDIIYLGIHNQIEIIIC